MRILVGSASILGSALARAFPDSPEDTFLSPHSDILPWADAYLTLCSSVAYAMMATLKHEPRDIGK